MWSPVQIRHRSAYYDAFYAEALMDFLASGLATPQETDTARRTVERLVGFCLNESREQVPSLIDGAPFDVVTAIAPSPHARFSRFFANIKSDLGFGLYVPDCDTTACSFSAATQFGSQDAMLDQPLIDFYAGYQIGDGDNRQMLTVPINDNIEFDGGIVTWIENVAGDRPYGNDLDPTLNLDVLELCFRNCERWRHRRYAAAAGDDPQDRPFPAPARRNRRVRRAALAHLLSAGALLRLFRPLLRRVPRAAARAAGRDRSGRQLRADPPPCHRLCPRRSAGGRDQRVRCGAGAARARQARRRARSLRAGAVLHRAVVRRGRPRQAVQGLRVEQDEDADAHPGRRRRGDVGVRAVGAGPRAAGDERGRRLSNCFFCAAGAPSTNGLTRSPSRKNAPACATTRSPSASPSRISASPSARWPTRICRVSTRSLRTTATTAVSSPYSTADSGIATLQLCAMTICARPKRRRAAAHRCR